MLKPLLALLALTASAASPPPEHPVEIIPGGILHQEPDGNTIVFEDAKGLIVVDTGRHLEHQTKILDYAKKRGKPIVSIVNTHWHLDHSGGNQELRAAYPQVKIYTSNAVRGAIDGFLARGVEQARPMLDRADVSEEQKAAIRPFFDTMDHSKDLLPDVAVTGPMRLGRIELHLAPNAATEGDTWLYDSESKTLVAGDLVVLPVPYFDTACAEGWRKALEALSAHSFERLVPGHGPSLSRAQFEIYRTAYGKLIDCAASQAAKSACIDGWISDAGPLLTEAKDQRYARGMLDYYVDAILRSADKQKEFCGAQG